MDVLKKWLFGNPAAVPAIISDTWDPASSPQAERTRSAWFAASCATGWHCAADWWTPAVDAVVEAVVVRADLDQVCRRLGRERAEMGVPIEEVFDDIVALWKARGRGNVTPDVMKSVASGWAEVGLEPAGSGACVDAMTGLATRQYLEARLAEIYRDVRSRASLPSALHLVVLDLGAVSPSESTSGRGGRPEVPTYDGTSHCDAPSSVMSFLGALPPSATVHRKQLPDDGVTDLRDSIVKQTDLWQSVEMLYQAVEAMRRVFCRDEILVRLAEGRVAALTAAGPPLGERLVELDELLDAAGLLDHGVAVWVESLPRTYGLVSSLLTDLAR